MRSRVVPGRSSTIAVRLPVSRLKRVDLPTFGRPTSATTGLRGAIKLCSFGSGSTPQGVAGVSIGAGVSAGERVGGSAGSGVAAGARPPGAPAAGVPAAGELPAGSVPAGTNNVGVTLRVGSLRGRLGTTPAAAGVAAAGVYLCRRCLCRR